MFIYTLCSCEPMCCSITKCHSISAEAAVLSSSCCPLPAPHLRTLIAKQSMLLLNHLQPSAILLRYSHSHSFLVEVVVPSSPQPGCKHFMLVGCCLRSPVFTASEDLLHTGQHVSASSDESILSKHHLHFIALRHFLDSPLHSYCLCPSSCSETCEPSAGPLLMRPVSQPPSACPEPHSCHEWWWTPPLITASQASWNL